MKFALLLPHLQIHCSLLFTLCFIFRSFLFVLFLALGQEASVSRLHVSLSPSPQQAGRGTSWARSMFWTVKFTVIIGLSAGSVWNSSPTNAFVSTVSVWCWTRVNISSLSVDVRASGLEGEAFHLSAKHICIYIFLFWINNQSTKYYKSWCAGWMAV